MEKTLKNNFSSIKNIETYPIGTSGNINVIIYLDAKEDKKNMDVMERYIFANYHSINKVKFIPMIKIKDKWISVGGKDDI